METRELRVHAQEGLAVGGDPEGENYLYYSLESGDQIDIGDAEAAGSDKWQIAFKRYIVKLNSGLAGPGGVLVACIDPPEELTRAEFIKLTPEDLKLKFDAVTEIPEGIEWIEEGVEPAIIGWRVLKDGSWSPPVGKAWKLRLADGASYAKMRVIKIHEDGQTITMRYAFQNKKDGELGPDTETELKPGQAFSFHGGAVVEPEGAAWDLRHGGAKLFLNSSVSGPGKAGAIGSNKYGALWKEVTNPSDSIAYFMDEFGAALRDPKWYRYNIDGNHNIHPNGAVYAVKLKDAIYKAQIYEYFASESGAVGNFRVRYTKIG